jgi:non-ribosomal peptide synthetase component F
MVDCRTVHQIADQLPEALKPHGSFWQAAMCYQFRRSKIADVLRGNDLINGYGPTENTTFTCCYRIRDSYRSQGSVPIGRPISNTQVYILDGARQPVPIGVPGELYMGGDGLALSYLNQPELTAEKFVPNPFSVVPGEHCTKLEIESAICPMAISSFLDGSTTR